jgi:hypothetical protein
MDPHAGNTRSPVAWSRSGENAVATVDGVTLSVIHEPSGDYDRSDRYHWSARHRITDAGIERTTQLAGCEFDLGTAMRAAEAAARPVLADVARRGLPRERAEECDGLRAERDQALALAAGHLSAVRALEAERAEGTATWSAAVVDAALAQIDADWKMDAWRERTRGRETLTLAEFEEQGAILLRQSEARAAFARAVLAAVRARKVTRAPVGACVADAARAARRLIQAAITDDHCSGKAICGADLVLADALGEVDDDGCPVPPPAGDP